MRVKLGEQRLAMPVMGLKRGKPGINKKISVGGVLIGALLQS